MNIGIISKSDTINKRGDLSMATFIVRKPEKEVISLRLPSELLKEIDAKSAVIGISRNELINQALVFALSNMEEPKDKEN